MQHGSGWTWRRVSAAPWRRIGIWAGGVFGVLVTSLVLFLTFADWNALRGPIGRMASSATGREIVIAGDLDVNPWSWTPEFTVNDLRIGNPEQFRERGRFAVVRRGEASVRLLPLFVGRFDFVRIDLRGADIWLYRNARAASNWAPSRASTGRQFDLPAIRAFSLRDGHVRLIDEKRNMTLDATFTTEESVDPRNPGRFELNGEGRLNNRPFTLELTGAPLLNVRRDRPYPFVADVRAGGTRIEADGSIRRPFNFNAWQADVRASGPDLADLYYLVGLALPNTPPYNLHGKLNREGARFGMPRVAGRVGDSDVRGTWTAAPQQNGRLLFEGDFRSNSLDFDDLMAVLGGPPDTSETASAEQRQMAANLAAQGRLLPDAQLDISRVRNMDAQVSYRAARVRSQRVPLRGVSVNINLNEGLLRLDPMTLDLTRGRIGGALSINARRDTPRVDLDVRLTNARLESIFRIGGRQPMTGDVQGRLQLTGYGASVRDAAANANGQVTFVVPSGEVREAFAELTGINVTRGLGLLLSDDQSKIAVRCGVASFSVNNGIARSRTIVFDTETMLIEGSGTISLRNEALDLEIEGEPKEPRLIRVAAPISIEGRLRSPRVGVEIEDAADQGLAAVLATIAAPLAAVLPFIDPGLAEDANCAALLAGRSDAVQREG
ncbi:MAG TPA: AsmA family protein [Vitreimonas sp.]|nr:AsmA family protein [Vitreimonas sp.]